MTFWTLAVGVTNDNVVTSTCYRRHMSDDKTRNPDGTETAALCLTYTASGTRPCAANNIDVLITVCRPSPLGTCTIFIKWHRFPSLYEVPQQTWLARGIKRCRRPWQQSPKGRQNKYHRRKHLIFGIEQIVNYWAQNKEIQQLIEII